MGELDLMRVDHIGSLRRPQALLDLRVRVDDGEATSDELTALEDELIRQVIAEQERIGFPIVTDGEFRRSNFQDSFGASVSGYDTPESREEYRRWQQGNRSDQQQRVESGPQVAGPPVTTRGPAVERLTLTRNLPLEEYLFAASAARASAKVTLIGPDRVAQRFDWQASEGVYEDLDDFRKHVAEIQREMVRQLVEAGCPYVHIDAPGYTAYVDEPSLAAMRSRGEDPAENLTQSIAADNRVIEGVEATCGIHLCRGNSRAIDPLTGRMVAQWHREGHYDDIAEQLFTQLNHKRLMLEYDSERSGSFEPLRFVPKDKIVVLGLVTTKSTDVETMDDLKRRIDEAARYIDGDQLALSPQCGFASGGGGETVPEDVQWRKLDVILETASRVWG